MGIIVDVEKPLHDAFGRSRVATPLTLFDSKLIGDNKATLWDDQEVSGGGTGSSYDINASSVTLSTSATTAGKRVRQTYQRFNYQPGKSTAIFITAVVGAATSGVTKRIGYFDDNNGIFFEQTDSNIFCVIRNNGTDSKIPRTSWTVSYTYTSRFTGSPMDGEFVQKRKDPFDGTGESCVTLDLSKAQIFFFDLEWLGVGNVRFGLVIDGYFLYVHEQAHANILDGVYMRSPNLPIRYEIESTADADAGALECICSTVISEGGQDDTGVTRYISTAGTHVDANVADTLYAILGMRLKSTHIDNVVRIIGASIVNETAGDFEWVILLNPTVAGVFSYSDLSASAIQYATGATANTVTGGTQLSGGFVASGTKGGGVLAELNNLRYLGAAIDGTADEIVLAARPLSANADIQAGITFKESA